MSWRNHATAAVALIIDNDERLQRKVRMIARKHWVELMRSGLEGDELRWSAVDAIAREITAMIDDEAEKVSAQARKQGMYFVADLLAVAASEVDYYALAEHYIQQNREEDEWFWRELDSRPNPHGPWVW